MQTALCLFLAVIPLGYALSDCDPPSGNYGDAINTKMEDHRAKVARFDPFVIAPTKKFFVGYSHFSVEGAVNGLELHDFSEYEICNVHAEKNNGSTDFDITVFNDEIAMEGGVQLDAEVFKLKSSMSANLSVTLTNAGVQTSGTAEELADGRKKLSNFNIRHFFDEFEVEISCPGPCQWMVGLLRVNERLSHIGERALRASLKLDPLEAKLVEAIMNHDKSEIKSLVKERLEKLAKKIGEKLSGHFPKHKGKGLFHHSGLANLF